jgi:hypothetical protein
MSLHERNPHRIRSTSERVLEAVPATLSWGTLAAALILSITHPGWAAIYIVVFDVYWVLKAINTAFHLLSSYNHYRHDITVNWLEILNKMQRGEYATYIDEHRKNTRLRWKEIIDDEKARFVRKGSVDDYRNLYHVVLFPFVDESFEILKASVQGVLQSNYPKDRVIMLLAAEERVGESAQKVAQALKQEYGDKFRGFLIGTHPDGLPGEIRGKSANASYAVKETLVPWLAKENIKTDQVIISNLDSDTVIHTEYLARVTYEWLLAPNPYRRSYQPITLYNNNIWESPALVRVIAVANSFWQFMESSRPDRLRTFSSHSLSLKTLMEVGYWKKDVVNEDSCIFWQCYFHFNGEYYAQPVFIPVSMDTCMADTLKQTMINQYKQKRRWAYNVEYFPWLSRNLFSNKKIPLHDRFYKFFQYVEGNYNWATASIMITSLGFLPTLLGDNFSGTVLGFNLPVVTRLLMNVALIFLVFSVYINMVLLPPRPARYTWTRTLSMYAQWMLVPFISIIWGCAPALEAQTRVAFAKYMEFWVTPKARLAAAPEANTIASSSTSAAIH